MLSMSRELPDLTDLDAPTDDRPAFEIRSYRWVFRKRTEPGYSLYHRGRFVGLYEELAPAEERARMLGATEIRRTWES